MYETEHMLRLEPYVRADIKFVLPTERGQDFKHGNIMLKSELSGVNSSRMGRGEARQEAASLNRRLLQKLYCDK